MLSKVANNLKQIRKLRRITQAELAAQLSILSGEQILPVTVSRWENGRRHIPADMLGYAAIALHTSAQAFFDYRTEPDDKRLILEYAAMRNREKSILRYIVSGWDGDAHALIHWIALYMSVNRDSRVDFVLPAISNYQAMRDCGSVDKSAPLPDMDYLKEACNRMIENKKLLPQKRQELIE